jgi:uncharacterized repeat protein (TIGR03803 family)
VKPFKSIVILCAVWVSAGNLASAQSLTTLHKFCAKSGCPDGAVPTGLVQVTNGDLYGTTESGGAYGYGTVFKMTSSGKLTTLYNFCAQSGCPDGAYPLAGVVEAANGDLYGTTSVGGAYGSANTGGTVFKITPEGTLTTLHSFCAQNGCPDGELPQQGVVEVANGDLYGTTEVGGAYDEGTIFKITPGGTLTTLHSFCAQGGCPDGEAPGGLILATNGDLYGMTPFGGAHNGGTVFKITQAGTLSTLHNFCRKKGCTDGANPGESSLVQASNGDLYGTTFSGGAYGNGTLFEITLKGALTTLYSFCSPQIACADGAIPEGNLVQAIDGNLYGATYGGGLNHNIYTGGTVFKSTLSGTVTTLYSFCPQGPCTDGDNPNPLLLATSGELYGTTNSGGARTGDGTIYMLSVGLGPFVETLPSLGKVGAAVTVLGSDLTGTTSVTFNGTAATFTVVSESEIKTTVPTGATTGTVEVTTPSSTLTSNVAFQIKQ